MNKLIGLFRKDNQSSSFLGKKTSFDLNLINPQQLVSVCCQSIGKQREHNEDFLFCFSSSFGGDKVGSSFGLFVVADGMGGHQLGEVASSIAVQTVVNYLLDQYQPYFNKINNTDQDFSHKAMMSAIEEAQKAVIEAAPGSGTTLTVALVLKNQVTIGHVGDSRAYTINESGQAVPITRDHSIVKRLEELGQITTAEALTHPQKNVLYQAIGHDEEFEADVFSITFPQPGYLLLCSDGLWNVVPVEKINKIISEFTDLHSACQEMVFAANTAGGPDNISVILVQLIG